MFRTIPLLRHFQSMSARNSLSTSSSLRSRVVEYSTLPASTLAAAPKATSFQTLQNGRIRYAEGPVYVHNYIFLGLLTAL
jgi:hypothetical protein